MNLAERKIQLENLGVHDLRNIARMWGVSSPTIMKKENLINEILQIMSGEKKLTIKQKAGRPIKNKLMGRGFQEDLLPKQLLDFAEQRNKDNILIDRFLPFAQGPEENEINSVIEQKEGYLIKHNQDYYFCTEDDDLVYVPDVLIAQFGLVVGDFLSVIASGVKGKNYFMARDIEKLNGKKFENCFRQLCSIKDVVLCENNEIIEDLKEGSKTHIYSPSRIEFIEKKASELNKLVEKGYTLLIVAVGLSADGLLKAQKHLNKFSSFVSYFENEPLYAFEAVNNAINHATVLARTGKKVIIVVLNIENIYTELDLYFFAKGENKDIHAYSTMKTLRKLMGLNRCLSNGGSITIYSTTSDKEFQFI